MSIVAAPQLPFSSGGEVYDYIEQALALHHFLQRQIDFSPRNSLLNEHLAAFVDATLLPRSREDVASILRSPAICKIASSLRGFLGRAEYEMERYSATAMIGSVPRAPRHYGSYHDFIYKNNYEALIESELKAMKWDTKRPPIKEDRESIAFVGAGSLAMSAIILAVRTGLRLTCIDSDQDACRLGRNLIRFLASTDPFFKNLDKQVSYLHKAGAEHDYATHPIVFIASLVPRKDPILMRIIQTSHTASTTVIRSAEGLSTLLYQPEDCRAGQEFYNCYFSGKSDPRSEAINTSLVYKLPPGKLYPRNRLNWQGSGLDELDMIRPRGKHMPRQNPHEL